MFRESVVASYSTKVHGPFDPWKVRQLGCLERSGTNYPVTWRHIPENKNWYLVHTSANT